MAEDQEPHRTREEALRTARANMARPGPLGWKVRRFLANEVSKIVHLQRCCGHPGEPGC